MRETVLYLNMLSKFTLKNVKSYQNESELHIAPITLIYGRNSAGKSTLWKLLRVLGLSEYHKNSYFPLSIINPRNEDFFSNIKSFSFDNKNPFSFGFELLDTGSFFLNNYPNIGEPQKVKFNYTFSPIVSKEIVTYDELRYLEEKMQQLEQRLHVEEKLIKSSTSIDKKTSEEILKFKQKSIDSLSEQRDMTKKLLNNLNSPTLVAERVRKIGSPDAVNMERNLELKIDNENFMNFKIIDSKDLKFIRDRMTNIDAGQGVADFICNYFKKKFILRPTIKTGDAVITTRKLDAVGPLGVLEIKLTNKDLLRSSFDLFIPENVSSDKKFYKNYFDCIQSAKKLLNEITQKKFNLDGLVVNFIKELKDEHRLKYRIRLEEVPNIKKVFGNFEKLLNTDSLDEFSKILSEDFKYMILLGFNLFPKEKIYGGLYHNFLDISLSQIFSFANDEQGESNPRNAELNAINVNKILDYKKFTKDNYFFNNWLKFTNINEQIHRLTTQNQFFKNLKYISNKEENLMTESRITTSEILGLKDISSALKKIDLQFDINVTNDGDKAVATFKNLSIGSQQKNTISLRESGEGLGKLLSILMEINTEGGLNQDHNQYMEKRLKKEISSATTFILEEPENKIHPKIQGNLIEYLSNNTFDSEQMFIIETHSEHFILRLQKLIRENKLDPNMLAINYVYLDENGEGSQIDHMKLDENGRFINKWRHGFFSERLEEI